MLYLGKYIACIMFPSLMRQKHIKSSKVVTFYTILNFSLYFTEVDIFDIVMSYVECFNNLVLKEETHDSYYIYYSINYACQAMGFLFMFIGECYQSLTPTPLKSGVRKIRVNQHLFYL